MTGRAPGPTGALLGSQLLVAGQLEGLAERPLVVTAVEDQPRRRRVGEGLTRDEVAPTDLGRVDADLASERVDGALDGVGGLGPARAAVGVGWRLRREHAGADERVRRHVVGAVVEEGTQQGDAGSHELEVRPHVGKQPNPHGADLPVGVGSQLDVLDLPPALDRRLGVLGPVLVPPHRPLEPAGQSGTEELLGVDVQLGAEPSADRGGDHPQLGLGHAEAEAQHHLEDVWDLGGRVHGVLVAERLGHHADTAGLHGFRDEPLLDVALSHGVHGLGEGPLHGLWFGGQLPGVGRVGRQLGVDQHPVGDGVLEVDHGREDVVVHRHESGGVLGHVGRLGDHGGHRVPHVPGVLDGQRQVGRIEHLRRDRPGAGQGLGPLVAEIGAAEGGHDPRQGQGGRGVDRADAGVGVGTAHQPDVQGARYDEVVDESSLARQQARVFPPGHRGPDDPGHTGIGDSHTSASRPPAAARTALTMLW